MKGLYKCDECDSEDVMIVTPEPEKLEPVKMSEASMAMSVPLVYKLTTLECNHCGYQVTF